MVIKMTDLEDTLTDKEVSALLSALYHSVRTDVEIYNSDIERVGEAIELGDVIELKRTLILKIIKYIRGS